MTEHNVFGQEIRPLCFTRDDDELLALGYPHLRRLVDGHRDDGSAESNAIDLAYDWRKILSKRIDWPREVAQRFVRLAESSVFQDSSRTSQPTAGDLAHARTTGSPTEEEARRIIAFALKQSGSTYTWRVRQVNFLLEAMVGTEVVVDAIVTALESLPVPMWTSESGGPNRQTAGHIFELGFMLCRLPEARRTSQRARLEVLRARYTHGAIEPIRALEQVLLGRAAFTGPRRDLLAPWLLHVDDDPVFLREVAAHKESNYSDLDVRFVYLAGVEILDVLGKHRPRVEEVSRFLEDIGKIKYATVVTLMLEQVGKRAAKKLPMTWFHSHESFARPMLDAVLLTPGPLQEQARLVVTELETAENRPAGKKR